MCTYNLLIFLIRTDLIKDNKREAERLPYRQIIFYRRRGGVSPPVIFIILLQA